MTGYVIGAVVLAFVVAGLLLSEEGPGRSSRSGLGSGFGGIFTGLVALLILVLVWGGGIAEFVGCVCVVLKLLSVEPVASWTWFEAFLPIIGGFVAQVIGVVFAELLG